VSLCQHGRPGRRCAGCSPDIPTVGAVVGAAIWFALLVAIAWWAVQ
jgi:hypothetical protein